MKILLSLFLLAVVFSLSSCSNTFYPRHNIEGTWERQSTDIDIDGIRMKVTLTSENTYTGKLITVTQKMIENCYDTGDVIWYNITPGARGMYDVDELTKRPGDCSTIHSSKYIRFTGENKISITSMEMKPNTGDNYQIWVRVTEE